ncbi:hypothetical protein IMY05_C4755000800 [Salix suchowensis]|nr:hypothetical protein IMY05_C4755000800 [Salix suchowensis]
MVNAAQRKDANMSRARSSQAQCVAQHLPLPSPAILQPNIQVPRRSDTSGMMPAGLLIGYSSAHVQHAAATIQWRSWLTLQHLKAYLSEGRSIPAILSGNQIAELALSHMLENWLKLQQRFQWAKSQIKVWDQQWNDLTNLDEEGHFGKSVEQGCGEKLLTSVRAHIHAKLGHNKPSQRKGKEEQGQSKDPPCEGSHYDSTINESPSKENYGDTGELVRLRLPLQSSKPRQEQMGSGNGLRVAMKHAGSARNLSGLGLGEHVEYSPIKVPTFHELIKSQSSKSPAWTCSPNLVRQGSLYSMAQLGIGTFKTCHTGCLVLHPGRALDNDLLGTLGTEDVAIKQVYLPSKEATSSSAHQIISRYGTSDERQKTLMEATLLCWPHHYSCLAIASSIQKYLH